MSWAMRHPLGSGESHSRVPGTASWYVLEGDGAFRKVSFVIDLYPEDVQDHEVLDGPFASRSEAVKAHDDLLLVEEVMES